MEQDTAVTEMLFRVDKTKGFEGTIFALMPYDIADRSGNITTYQHVGQHSAGDYHICLAQSKRATPSQYADLKKDLESAGYKIKVISHRSYSKYLKAYKASKTV